MQSVLSSGVTVPEKKEPEIFEPEIFGWSPHDSTFATLAASARGNIVETIKSATKIAKQVR
jgi:hypothetical protein